MKNLTPFLFVLLLFTKAFTQINPYTAGLVGNEVCFIDIDDDTLIHQMNSTVSKTFDINNDGINDFTFSRNVALSAGFYWNTLNVIPLNGSKIATDTLLNCFGTNYRLAIFFDFGDSIDLQNIFYQENSVFLHREEQRPAPEDTCNSYTSNLINNRYLGIQILDNGNLIHGWIKLGTYVIDPTFDLLVYQYGLNKTCSNNIGDNNQISEILIFPNPFTEFIILKSNKMVLTEFDVNIYNLMGQLVFNGSLESNKPINVSHFQEGMYTIVIKKGNSLKIDKFIKTN